MKVIFINYDISEQNNIIKNDKLKNKFINSV